MYALKIITLTPDNRSVERVQVLGDRYELEFSPKDAGEDIAAHVHYFSGDNIPVEVVKKTDEAYITTLNGDTVRVICRAHTK